MSRNPGATGLHRRCRLTVSTLALLTGLAPAAARAGGDDADRALLTSAQLQDRGALLRPPQRRGNLALTSGPALQIAALAPALSRNAQPTTLDAPPPPLAVAVVAPPALATASPAHAPTHAPANAPTHASTPAPAPTRTPSTAAAEQPLAAASPQLLAAAAPRNPTSLAAPEPRFDLAINNAPAAQVYLQLASGTPYNMLVSPEVSGTLSITLKDTTLPEAMDTLRELFGFEYRITGNRVFVYPNTVQTRLYRVNYLPGRRQGASDIRVSSSSMTATGNSGSSNGAASNPGNGNNNSSNGNNNSGGMASRADDNARVRTSSDADFWREVQASLSALVGTLGGRNVVLNPAAGVVVVKATPAELRQVEQYLKAVQVSIERQVMLEAKIVEVNLSKDAQTGINWAGFGKLGNGLLTLGSASPGATLGPTGALRADNNVITPGVDLNASSLGRGFYGLAFQAANFAALLNFLQTQGDVQVLSSPRIATLNNQKAVLKVGRDELYVTGVSSSVTSSGTSSVTTPTLTLQPFFSGISLDVTPQIDDAGNVMLHIHPTVSNVTEKNKNIDLGSLGQFKLPLASSAVNETDSIVRVRDGQIVAIGGLMKQESRDERTGLPVLSEAPVVGGLFRQTNTITSKRELVIMLKPTVIHEDGIWPDAPSFGGPTATPPAPAR